LTAAFAAITLITLIDTIAATLISFQAASTAFTPPLRHRLIDAGFRYAADTLRHYWLMQASQ
jgi:hypothetical protein